MGFPSLSEPGRPCPTAEAPLVPPQLISCPTCLPRTTPHPASTKLLLCWQESAFLIITPRKLSLMNASWETFFFFLALITLLIWISLQSHLSSPSHPILCPTKTPCHVAWTQTHPIPWEHWLLQNSPSYPSPSRSRQLAGLGLAVPPAFHAILTAFPGNSLHVSSSSIISCWQRDLLVSFCSVPPQ